MDKKVGIIILNWNSFDITKECLLSLQKLDIHGLTVTVYLVDNASTDNSGSKLHDHFPKIKYIQNEENLGYTGGNNRGMKQAIIDGCTHIWILNNDTVVDRQALLALVNQIENPKVGIAVSKIYFARGHEFHADRYKPSERGRVFWYAGGVIDWKNMYGSHRGVDEVDTGQYNKESETQYATGCSFLVKQTVLSKIGLFDDRYFAYFEDMDLSLRVQNAGFTVLYVPSSIVWHINAGSTTRPGNSFQQYYQIRNRLLIGLEYAPARTKLALIREGISLLFSDKTVKKQAVIDAFLHRFGKQYIWKK
jgi:GT2 family glycosyltransferase